ncbi:MAG TPA: prenyltransferase [Candidatus Sulfomarinibacteraceae bacterium]|nr:prenyltransferase [Candidatus Sulfomarinibacteraceae bacterium]
MVDFLRALIAFVRLGRPLFLAGGFVLHGLGAAMALYDGASLSLAALFWGQAAVTATQVMTHYSNDYFDLDADRANPSPTRWSGGSRILPQGRVAPRLALWAALVALVIALIAALAAALALRPGPLALPLLLLALFLAWSYSAPPLRLHSTGLGEAAGALLIAGLTPLVGYYLQAGKLGPTPLLAVTPLVLLQFVMLLVVSFPDERGDAAAGKETLVVRLGGARAARLLQLILVVFYLMLPLLWAAGLPSLVIAALLIFTLPGMVWMAWRVGQGKWREPAWWNWFGFVSIGLVVGSALVMLAAFLVS